MRKLLAPAVLLAAAAAALVVATRRDLGEPHVRLFGEMSRTPAYKAQTANPVLAGGLTQRAPAPGTLPRGFSRFPFENTPEDRSRAGKELKNPVAPSFEALDRGRRQYESKCRHCHGAKGRGDGAVAKAFPAFSFSVAAKSTLDLPDGTLFHVVTLGRNQMPSHALQLTPEDRWSVIHYLRDLQRREVARLGPLADLPEDPRRHHLVSADYGRELYLQNCGSCHGDDGKTPKAGVPTLNSPAVLAIADDAYYFDIISHGRKGTQMPAWDKSMTRTQTVSLVRYLRSWATPAVDRGGVLARAGDPGRGRAVYRGRCAGCHGGRGEGGIGNSLNSPTFLALASPQFFRDMVIGGREHTAMPSSYDLSTGEVADLVSYLRSWAKPRHSFEEFRRLLPEGSAATGTKLYSSRCAGCHGERGEGGIGSRLASESFLRMADDRFLYRALSEGRPGTAMPGWFQLSSRDLADLIALLRSWRRGHAEVLTAARRKGDPEFGRLVFEKGCVSCHGPEGRGGSGGQVGNPVFLDSVSDDFLWRTIARGKDDTAMRGFLEGGSGGAIMALASSDIDHVIAYLRSLAAKPRVDLLNRTFPGASAKVGRELFVGKGGCAKCHGLDAEGASGPSLASPSFLRAASDGYLAGTIILGREGTQMLSYWRGGNVHLAPREVMDLVAYLRDLEGKPRAKSRPVDRSAGSVAEGKLFYGRFCSSCHGTEGQGSAAGPGTKGYAPSLNSPEFLAAADDGFLQATIAIGRPNTPMRPFGAGAGGVADLSAEQIRKITAYIRSWERKP